MSFKFPQITFESVHEAARLSEFDSLSAQGRMSPRPRETLPQFRDVPVREAGVLALIYPEADGLHVLLTRRADTLRGHSGQVSFPGGRRDPEDESFIATAIRETREELGIHDPIRILGHLSSFYIPPSHYNVFPTVGGLDYKPQITPNPAEVAQVFSFALRDLLDEGFKYTEPRDFNGVTVEIPYYLVDGHKVWGATAVMLSELEHRLRLVLGM